jgi:hypothetical protein
VKALQSAAASIGMTIKVFSARNEREIDAFFANRVREHIPAFITSPDSLFNARREQIAALATYNAIAAMSNDRIYVDAGGAGLQEFCCWLLKTTGAQAQEIAVAIEAPRSPVVEVLLERGFQVFAINPKQLAAIISAVGRLAISAASTPGHTKAAKRARRQTLPKG